MSFFIIVVVVVVVVPAAAAAAAVFSPVMVWAAVNARGLNKLIGMIIINLIVTTDTLATIAEYWDGDGYNRDDDGDVYDHSQ